VHVAPRNLLTKVCHMNVQIASLLAQPAATQWLTRVCGGTLALTTCRGSGEAMEAIGSSAMPTYFPLGAKLPTNGTLAPMRLNSSIVKSTPASRANASICSTPLVEPPSAYLLSQRHRRVASRDGDCTRQMEEVGNRRSRRERVRGGGQRGREVGPRLA